MVAYAGVEETLRVFGYLDLQLRFAVIRLRMKWMGWNLKRRLDKDTAEFTKFIQEYKANEQRKANVGSKSDENRMS